MYMCRFVSKHIHTFGPIFLMALSIWPWQKIGQMEIYGVYLNFTYSLKTLKKYGGKENNGNRYNIHLEIQTFQESDKLEVG